MSRWRVAKFGGSSLSSRENLSAVTSIIRSLASEGPLAVVVSAPGATTSELLALTERARAGDIGGLQAGLDDLAARLRALVPGAPIEPLLERLADQLLGVRLLGELSDAISDHILAHGELISATLVSHHLQQQGLPGLFDDARTWLHTDGVHGRAVARLDATRTAVRERLADWRGSIPVSTGFIGRSPDGRTTTLGRDGSDYTASVLGAALDAREVQIWTDVPGVLTADPEVVPDARPLQRLTYGEALELSVFGARVLHPRTMIPLMDAGIPLRILQTTRPDAPGTRVDAQGQDDTHLATSVTCLDRQALIDIRRRRIGAGSDLAARIQTALKEISGEVWLGTQSAHGQAVTVVLPQAHLDRALAAIERALAGELAAGELDPLRTRTGLHLVTVVAEAMGRTPGVAARFFGALGRVGLNVLCSAQSASSRSISAVVDDKELAVRALHDAFHLDAQTVSVALVGHGLVGSALSRQLLAQQDRLAGEHDLDLRLVAVLTRSGLDFAPRGLGQVRLQAPPISIEAYLDRLATLPTPVVVDVTASEAQDWHLLALRRGIHVVTANKKPLAGSLGGWDALRQAARQAHRSYRYETTVGAGLPVIETLQHLVQTGDRVRVIEGALSGTLGYLTDQLMQEVPLATAVQRAQELGYTEPFAGEDLSGRDVARKALILAREAGLTVEPEQVRRTPLVPAELLTTPDGFQERLTAWQWRLTEEIAHHRRLGLVLRYVARVDLQTGEVSVGPRWVGPDHVTAGLAGPDALVSFTTARYDQAPLQVRGPGAGAEVTAAGVLADILRIAHGLRPERASTPLRAGRSLAAAS